MITILNAAAEQMGYRIERETKLLRIPGIGCFDLTGLLSETYRYISPKGNSYDLISFSLKLRRKAHRKLLKRAVKERQRLQQENELKNEQLRINRYGN